MLQKIEKINENKYKLIIPNEILEKIKINSKTDKILIAIENKAIIIKKYLC